MARVKWGEVTERGRFNLKIQPVIGSKQLNMFKTRGFEFQIQLKDKEEQQRKSKVFNNLDREDQS